MGLPFTMPVCLTPHTQVLLDLNTCHSVPLPSAQLVCCRLRARHCIPPFTAPHLHTPSHTHTPRGSATHLQYFYFTLPPGSMHYVAFIPHCMVRSGLFYPSVRYMGSRPLPRCLFITDDTHRPATDIQPVTFPVPLDAGCRSSDTIPQRAATFLLPQPTLLCASCTQLHSTASYHSRICGGFTERAFRGRVAPSLPATGRLLHGSYPHVTGRVPPRPHQPQAAFFTTLAFDPCRVRRLNVVLQPEPSGPATHTQALATRTHATPRYAVDGSDLGPHYLMPVWFSPRFFFAPVQPGSLSVCVMVLVLFRPLHARAFAVHFHTWPHTRGSPTHAPHGGGVARTRGAARLRILPWLPRGLCLLRTVWVRSSCFRFCNSPVVGSPFCALLRPPARDPLPAC